MEVISQFSPLTWIYVNLIPLPLSELDDPTVLDIDAHFSATAVLVSNPTWIQAAWSQNNEAVPILYYAKIPVYQGDLAVGVWYPFVRVHSTDEPILQGKPFRVA